MSGWQLLSVHDSIIMASVIMTKASSYRAQAVVAVCGWWRLGLELHFRFYLLKRGGGGGQVMDTDTPMLC
jgi:hypothetical protein